MFDTMFILFNSPYISGPEAANPVTSSVATNLEFQLHNLPSFGGEVKPPVPCRRFAGCNRSLNGVEVVISAKLPDNILAHSSTFRR